MIWPSNQRIESSCIFTIGLIGKALIEFNITLAGKAEEGKRKKGVNVGRAAGRRGDLAAIVAAMDESEDGPSRGGGRSGKRIHRERTRERKRRGRTKKGCGSMVCRGGHPVFCARRDLQEGVFALFWVKVRFFFSASFPIGSYHSALPIIGSHPALFSSQRGKAEGEEGLSFLFRLLSLFL